MNQYKFRYRTVLSASFTEQYEDDQVSDRIELYINLKNNQNITKSDIDNNNARLQLEQQIQNQDSKASGCRFDKSNSTLHSIETTELNG